MDVMDLLSGLGYALDTPGALTRGLLTGRPGERASGEDLLRALGIEDAGWLANTATEMAVDPMNLIGGLGVAKKLLGVSKVRTANKAIEGANAASKVMREAGAMPEEIAKLTKAVDETGKPMKVYHETGSPLFGPRDFLPDPGTGNYLGKGTYFTKRRGEPNGMYSARDKSASIGANLSFSDDSTRQFVKMLDDATGGVHQLQSRPLKEIKKDIGDVVDTLRKGKHNWSADEIIDMRDMGLTDKSLSDLASFVQNNALPKSPPAPRTMIAYVDARKPYVFEEPLSYREMRQFVSESGVGKNALRDLREERLRPEVHPILAEVQAGNVPIGFAKSELHSAGLTHVSFADTKHTLKKLAQGEMSIEDAARALGMKFETKIKKPIRKGDLWASLIDEAGTPDDISDILKAQGYDAVVHDAGFSPFTPKGYERVGLDRHSEVVAFDPKQIYAPWTYGTQRPLGRVPSANPLIAALLGYNTANQALPQ